MKALLAALAKARAEMPDPKKNAANPHLKNKFADLGEVMDCIETPLANNGLMVTQTLADPQPGVLVTTLWHVESGEHLTSSLPLLPAKYDPQAQGSAITYARRYALKAMFGMVDVDDDGNAASGRTQAKTPTKKEPAKKGSAPAHDIEPFELLEEALWAIDHAKTVDDFNTVRLRISASGFKGDELAQIVAAGKVRRDELGA